MKTLYKLILSCAFFSPFVSVAQKLPSADAVIARYVEVIGGRERWAAIKSSELHLKLTINKKTLKGLIIKPGSERYFESYAGSGIEVKQIYNKGKSFTVTNGLQKEVTDIVQLDHYELQSYVLPDLAYIKLNYKREMLGAQAIGKETYYVIALTSKNGSRNINYYEKTSGLLKILEKKKVKYYIGGYKLFKGYLIPTTEVADFGQKGLIKIELVDWLINKPTDLSVFDVKPNAVNIKQ